MYSQCIQNLRMYASMLMSIAVNINQGVSPRNDAAGFLHARQKAASHGNLASQDVETSNLQGDRHLVDEDSAPQPQQERRHLLPQSMSAMLSELLQQRTAMCARSKHNSLPSTDAKVRHPDQTSTVWWAWPPSPPPFLPPAPGLWFPDIFLPSLICVVFSRLGVFIVCSSPVLARFDQLSMSWL